MTRAAPLSQPGPIRQGLDAAKANRIPALLLWSAGVGLLIGYYNWPAFQEALDIVGEWKVRFGYLFSFISTPIFGAVIPLLCQQLTAEGRASGDWKHAPFLITFWALKGIEIDALYRFQAWVFGDEATITTVLIKTAFDQVIYICFWAVPIMYLLFHWKNSSYSLKRARETLPRSWYKRELLPILVTNWAIWIPTVMIIYSLPPALQLPQQNIVLSLFVLLILVLTRKQSEGEAFLSPSDVGEADAPQCPSKA